MESLETAGLEQGLTVTLKVSAEKRESEIKKALVDEVFYQIYDNKDIWDKAVFKLQAKLGWYREDNDWHDHQMCADKMMSGLFWRLSNAKISTLQGYLDDETAQKKLLGQVGFAEKDLETNSDKVYETVRQEVEEYDWKTDTTETKVKQVRQYQQTTSFDKVTENDDGSSNSLADSISEDDIREQAVKSVPDELNIQQVLANTHLFTPNTGAFIQMLLTFGSEETMKYYKLSEKKFKAKVKGILRYIKKHRDEFNKIPTGSQRMLTELSSFESVVQLYHPTQIEKWLRESGTLWAKELIDNDDISEWDRKDYREAVNQLKATFEKEVAR